MWPQQAGSQIVFQNTICAVHRLSNQKSSMSCRNQTRSRNARRQHRTLPVSSCTVCPLASKVLHGLPCPLTLPPQPCSFHWPSPAKPDVFLLALHLKLGNRPSSNINIFFCIFDLEEKKKNHSSNHSIYYITTSADIFTSHSALIKGTLNTNYSSAEI